MEFLAPPDCTHCRGAGEPTCEDASLAMQSDPHNDERPLTVLQVSTADAGGGAERVARLLHDRLRRRGHQAWLAVGRRFEAGTEGVVAIPDRTGRSRWTQRWLGIADRLVRLRERRPAAGRLLPALSWVADPGRMVRIARGFEDFDHPGSRRLLSLVPGEVDVVHAHNLHGGYFDLRFLAELSARRPVVLSLHDQWLTTGHCAYSFDCERWRTGCGACPYLSTYPHLRRDGTAANWRRKQDIYARSRLFVTSPSRWMLDNAAAAVLSAGTVAARVIPLGVDREVFRPGDRTGARRRLGLPDEAAVVLFVAHRARSSQFKDYATMERAVHRLAAARPVVGVCLGEAAPTEQRGAAEMRFPGHVTDPGTVADWYRAADLYLHAAKADNFPLANLEALACGTPVVATAVGGVGEQIRPLAGVSSNPGSHVPAEQATGVLVPPGDDAAMAAAAQALLDDAALRRRLADNAAADAAARFDLERCVDQHLAWYRQAQQSWSQAPAP